MTTQSTREMTTTERRAEVARIIRESSRPISTATIRSRAWVYGISYGQVHDALAALLRAGEVQRVSRGVYCYQEGPR